MLMFRSIVIMLSILCLSSYGFKSLTSRSLSSSMRSKLKMSKSGDGSSGNPVALVTGGGRGIGKAIALALADEGCKVVVNYFVNETQALEVVEEIKIRSAAKGGTAIAIQADCSNPDEVAAMFSSAVDQVRCNC